MPKREQIQEQLIHARAAARDRADRAQERVAAGIARSKQARLDVVKKLHAAEQLLERLDAAITADWEVSE